MIVVILTMSTGMVRYDLVASFDVATRGAVIEGAC
jgi:hypothetical protein